MTEVKVRQGDSGLWRWHLYRDKKHRGMSGQPGYGSRKEAVRAAREDFGDAVAIEALNGVLHAEGRNVG